MNSTELLVKTVVKRKQNDTQNSNKRFKFAGIKAREASTSADVFRKSQKFDISIDDDDLQNSYFGTFLDIMIDRNGTGLFGRFHRECWGLCRSLPEVIHHKQTILSKLLEYLALTANDQQTKLDLFELTTKLVQDCRHELFQGNSNNETTSLIDLLRQLLQYVNPLSPLETEGVFRCVGQVLVYNGVEDLDSMRVFYGGVLGNKKEFVRRLGAECFASLIRKATKKQKKKHTVNVVKGLTSAVSSLRNKQDISKRIQLETEENTMDGIAQLFFYVVKGVSGKISSKGDVTVVHLVEALIDSKVSKASIVSKLVQKVLIYICRFVERSQLEPLWSCLFESIGKCISHNSPTHDKLKYLLDSICVCIETSIEKSNLTSEMEYKEGAQCVKYLKQLLVEDLYSCCDSETRRSILRFLTTSWGSYSGCNAFILHLTPLFSSITTKSVGVDQVLAAEVLANDLLPILPRKVARQSLAPVILSVAANVVEINLKRSLFLIHKVVSLPPREDDVNIECPNRVFSDNDSVIFVEDAQNSTIKEEDYKTITSILLSIDAVGALSGKDESIVFLYILLCLPSLCLMRDDSSVTDQILHWLCNAFDCISMPADERLEHDYMVLKSTALSALSVLCSHKFSDEKKDNDLRKSVLKIKTKVEKFVLASPDSVTCLSSTAAYVKFLSRENETLTDAVDELFDALTPNLRNGVHAVRYHTLDILTQFPLKSFIVDHAALDMADDLEEDPSFNPEGKDTSKEVVLSGPCKTLENLLTLESLEVTLKNERKLTSEMNQIEVAARSGRFPAAYAEATANMMLGVFSVKFKPLWEVARKTLISLCLKHEDIVWVALQNKLEEIQNVSERKQLDSLVDNKDEMYNLYQSSICWEASSGYNYELFSKRASGVHQGSMTRFECTDDISVFENVWQLLYDAPFLLTKNSKVIVSLFLDFLHSQYFVVHNEDIERRELSLASCIENDSRNIEMADFTPSIVFKKLVSFLRVFSVVKGSQQLHKHPTLQKIFISFLSHSNINVAQLSLSCLMGFRLPYLVPYASELQAMLTKGQLREILAKFDIDLETGIVDKQHRKNLIPIATRILFGRMTSKGTGSKSSKDTPESRRAAVLSFLSRFEDSCNLVYMMTRVFASDEAYNEDTRTFDETFCRNVIQSTKLSKVTNIQSIPEPKLIGYLNLLIDVVSSFGYAVIEYLDVFTPICLSICEFSERYVGGSGEIRDNSAVAMAKKLRPLSHRAFLCMFDQYCDSFDFHRYSERLWACLTPAIERLPSSISNAEKPPSVLLLLEKLSARSKLIDLLSRNQEVIKYVFQCISNCRRACVVDVVLSFLENLLNDLNHGTQMISKNILLLIEQFGRRLEVSGNTLLMREKRNPKESDQNTSNIGSKELKILCKVCALYSNDDSYENREAVGGLCRLLLPYLNLDIRMKDDLRLSVLETLSNLLPHVKSKESEKFFVPLSKLLGPTKFNTTIPHALKQEAVTCISVLAVDSKIKDTLSEIVGTLNDLMAIDKSRLDEPDYSRIVPALSGLSSSSVDASNWMKHFNNSEAGSRGPLKGARVLSPIIYHCLSALHDDDAVISRGGFAALKEFLAVSAVEGEKSTDDYDSAATWKLMVETALVPAIKIGLSCKRESSRRFYILLISEVSRSFTNMPNPQFYGDMCKLMDFSDKDQDFFFNITHIQHHRRSRALNKLAKFLDQSELPLSSLSVSSILLPIVLNPIYECQKNSEEAYAQEAIKSLGVISKYLSWSKYQSTLSSLITQFNHRGVQKEKILISAICSLLDGFHFQVKSSDVDETNESNTVWKALTRRIIPSVEELMTIEGRDKGGSRTKEIRAPVAMALLKLYKKLPHDYFEGRLPNLLLTVCDVLKHPESVKRDAARDTLCNMAVDLGPAYLCNIIKELQTVLVEGFQLHVLASTLRSILSALSEVYQPNYTDDTTKEDLPYDECVPVIMEIILEDLFGKPSELKEAEGAKRRLMKEAMGSKSYDALEIMCRCIYFNPTVGPSSSIHNVVNPLIEKLKESDLSEVSISKVQECLNRVILGLSANKSVIAKEILPFIYETANPLFGIKENSENDPYFDSDNESDDDTTIKVSSGHALVGKEREENSEIKGKTKTWRPSAKGIAQSAKDAMRRNKRAKAVSKKVLDGASAPKLTGRNRHGNAAVFLGNLNDVSNFNTVNFGLLLLYSFIKKSQLNREDNENRSMASPFLPMLTKCVEFGGNDKLVLNCLRCLGLLLSWNLPSAKQCARKLGSNVLIILSKQGSSTKDRAELTQACYKILAFLMKRDDNSNDTDGALPLSFNRMRALVIILKEAISDADQKSSELNLIKAIVSRVFLCPEIYDIMDVILNLTVQSQKENIRKQCNSILLIFLIDYPLENTRFQQMLRQILSNLEYQFVSGRTSTLEVLSKVLEKLPLPLIEENGHIVFIPLVLSYTNETSEQCRILLKGVLITLLKRVSPERLTLFSNYCEKWFSDNNDSLKISAIDIFGIMISERSDFIKGNTLPKRLVSSVTDYISTENKDDVCGELVHHCLLFAEQLVNVLPQVLTASFYICVCDQLKHEHAFVQQAALKIILNYNARLNSQCLSDDCCWSQQYGLLHIFAKNICDLIDMNNGDFDEATSILIIKNLTWNIQAMRFNPSICYHPEVPQTQVKDGALKTEIQKRDPVYWLLARLSKSAKVKKKFTRMVVFKAFAAFTTVCEGTYLQGYLEILLEPLQRVLVEHESKNVESEDELITLTNDVMHLLEGHCESESFIAALSKVKSKARNKRDERKKAIAIQMVANPEAAAERKIKKHLVEKNRRKRRMDEKKVARGKIISKKTKF